MQGSDDTSERSGFIKAKIAIYKLIGRRIKEKMSDQHTRKMKGETSVFISGEIKALKQCQNEVFNLTEISLDKKPCALVLPRGALSSSSERDDK